jgi:fumarate hydratase class II
VAKEAFATGRSLREVVLARGLMDAATLDRALEPLAMTRPGDSALAGGG